MAILRTRGELNYSKFEYLLRGPKVMGADNPLHDWVSDGVWGSVQALKVRVRGQGEGGGLYEGWWACGGSGRRVKHAEPETRSSFKSDSNNSAKRPASHPGHACMHVILIAACNTLITCLIT